MLRLENICVFGGGQELIHSVSEIFEEGKVTILIGGSGSGKSLLLKTAAYIHPPATGDVWYRDENLGRISEDRMKNLRKDWGFMFQDSALWSDMSVYENLALPLRFHNPSLKDAEIKEKIERLAREIRFTAKLDQRPIAFSAGKQKVLSFMRAVVNDPQLLFLDEPSTFVDRSGFMPIFRKLETYRRQKRTVMMVTHELDLARSLGDNLMVVRDGRIIAHGPMDELLESKRSDIQQEILDSFQQGEQE
ncbi:ABC transporter ATP-binding protein [Spirochaeta dissipatitropha]